MRVGRLLLLFAISSSLIFPAAALQTFTPGPPSKDPHAISIVGHALAIRGAQIAGLPVLKG